MAKRYVGDDIVAVKSDAGKRIATLFWGDEVKFLRTQGGQPVIELRQRVVDRDTGESHEEKIEGFLKKGAKLVDESVLRVRFVDVGQGDGAIVETPKGRLLLVDGGQGEHIANYVATAFRSRLGTEGLPIEAVIVTHGDADHFAGLTKLATEPSKKGNPLIRVNHVFHNGLVKRGSKTKAGTSRKDTEMFGKTKVGPDGRPHAVELVDDLRNVADGDMNVPFKAWREALKGLKSTTGKKPKVRRLELGDDDAFSFLSDEDIGVQGLGPIVEDVGGGTRGLPFLRTPGSGSLSASHTVNGHSIVLRINYGNVKILLGADLNEESEERLLAHCREAGLSLASEVLKVPHHGSADFSPRVLQAISPVVSVVSSGDESTRTEYIHPRAGLVGALGKYSRASVAQPLVYVTEMVAFFERLGRIVAFEDKGAGEPGKKKGVYRQGYCKAAFGIVHVRTDGERVLVATPSGKDDSFEAYAFRVDERGDVEMDEVTKR